MKTLGYASPLPRFPQHSRRGFTLIELLVVIAIIAILAAMLLPALSRAKQQAQSTLCMSNNKQIMLAYKMYVDDFRGYFPANEEGGTYGWIAANEMDYNGSIDDTLIADLIGQTTTGALPRYAQLAPYVANQPKIFKCPADMSCQFGNKGQPRIRTYSMSQSLGPATVTVVNGTVTAFGYSGQGYWLPSQINSGGPWMCYFKESDLSRPSPSRLWVTVEEDPDSINDGAWGVKMPQGSATTWIDFPSRLHGGSSGSFSFMDGHSELKGWQHPECIPVVTYKAVAPVKEINNNSDIFWVATRSSARVNGEPNGFPED
jgi:prepilin-type N-terminal cleavage/methylation domain-containing protein